MYLPQLFEIIDSAEIDAFITAHPFGALVSVVDGVPFATHIPLQWVVHDDSPARFVHGHVARANPHWRSLSPEQEVLVMFTGPHSYITPRWYAPGNNVPTWSYTAVHVYGRPRIVDDPDELHGMIKRLVDQYETQTGIAQPYRIEDMQADYITNLMKGTVGFEITVTRVEAKYKLSQNRQLQDAHQVMATLAQQPDEVSRAVAQMMHRVYD